MVIFPRDFPARVTSYPSRIFPHLRRRHLRFEARMGLGFNLFLGDQMAVLASDVVCVRLRLLRCPTPGLVAVLVCIRLRLLRCPTPGLVVCCGAVTAPSGPAV